MQTLLQLLTPSGTGYSVASVEIEDTPRFAYRGFMLDVSRHFFSKEFVKKQIDALAFYKINRLHLHLTDAAGWRIEIRKYPLLTDFAAWRTEPNWKKWWNGGREYVRFDEPGASGGYYTQKDICEILEYARQHYMTVIPEIEMPSHSEEVLAAYPQLSCSGEPYKNSDFCVGNEETFAFLENVLTEVMELFPSEYIHIGGDEAGKSAWKTCPKCQKRMKDEHLANVDELQSYLIHRIEKFLNAHGRHLLGWDEILQGGMAPNATVMSWRGEEGGIAAVTSGHRAVMTPGAYCYLDSYQDAPYSQPEAIGGYLPLKKVYSYDPVSVSLTVEKGPFIVVTGHDLEDIKQLLEQTKDKGINIYTHGEMLPAHAYPELKKYPHLKGNFGTAWQNQQKEFASLPAPILFTTNCLMPPKASYEDRVFTTGAVVFPNTPFISSSTDGHKDFTPVIEKALELGGFSKDQHFTGINGGSSVMTGFARNAILSSAGEIVDAVKSGAIRHFFLVAGCDGARAGRNYYTEFVKQTPSDSIVLTLACGKY